MTPEAIYTALTSGAMVQQASKLSDDGLEPRLVHENRSGGSCGRPRRGTVAAVTVIPGVVFSDGWDGMLHALSTADGHEIWQTGTAQEFKTVNGVPGKGGSLGAPGPVVEGGKLYVGSGYIGTGNGMPGNVLLAFSPQ